MRLRSAPLLALAAALTTAGPAVADILTWNNTGTAFGAASSWTPSQVPTTADVTQFTPSGSLPFVPATVTPTAVNNPVLGAAQAVLSLTFAPNQQLGGWTLTGGGNTLTIGGGGSTGLTTRGPATYRLTDVLLAGASSPNFLALNVGNGSELVLGGTTATGANLGTTLGTLGGTLTLDNSSANVNARLGATPVGTFLSGTLNLIGNAGGTAATVGLLTGSTTAGVNTFRATSSGGGAVSLTFANSGTVNTRLSTFSVLRFEAGNGTLGGAAPSDPRIFFTGTPTLGNNGLLAAGAGTFGYALASDPSGTDFATYNGTGTTGSGVVKATPTQTATTLTAVTGTNNSSRVQYNPAADDALAATALTVGSLRITPTANNLTAALGSTNLVTNAFMLDGPNDFAITGTGTLGGGGTRYIYVNDPAAALSTSLVLVGSNTPMNFGGPGLLILTGTAVQNPGASGATTNRLDLMAGTVRGTNTNLGLQLAASGSDTYSLLNFRGGVLEIAGGANGAGTAADFTRGLGNVDGQVRWEGGAGGFSAFGPAASVNIGGAATPTGLQWATANFVQDGFALRFGSTRSNAVVTFQNPLQLDNGGAYQLREVTVIGGVGGDRTVFQGVVSGAANADLIKTGTGTLVLAAANTYAGNTFVQAGTVIAGGTGLGGGRVLVGSGATLAPGTIAPADARPGPAVLTTGAVGFQGGSTFAVRVTGAVATQPENTGTSGVAGTNFSQLVSAGGITFGAGTLFAIDLTGVNFTSGGVPYSFQIGTAASGSNVISGASITTGITFTDNGADVTGTITGANVQLSGTGVFLNFTPVPEPATVLAVAAAALGGLRLARRRRF